MDRLTLRRLFLALFVAGLMALGIGVLNAEDEYEGCDDNDPNSTCFYTYNTGMCAFLTPYSYWWGFWGCETRMEMTVEDEDVTVTPAGDYAIVHIRRLLPDGSVVEIVRIVPRRNRPND